MIRLIVTSCGYVESNQMAKILWSNNEDNFSPEQAIKSLASDLAFEFRAEHLYDLGAHTGHTYNIDNTDLSMQHCSICSKPIRQPFYLEEFATWLTNLSSAVASGDLYNFSINELDNWWPWHSFSELYHLKPEEILLVEEKFEVIAALSLEKSFLSKDEDQAWNNYIEEHFPYKVTKDKSGFWIAETIYED